MQNNVGMADLDALKNCFRSYALSFAESPEKVPQAIRLKIGHTFDVCSIATHIAARESAVFGERGRYLAELAALFHDVSRFRQYRDFKTFRDAESFDHGCVSAEIFRNEFPVEGLSEEEKKWISAAVEVHNKRTLPADLASEILPFAEIVRDADKISIIKIINDFLAAPEEYQDAVVKIGMEESPGFTEQIARDAIAGKQIAHSSMRNLNDFKISIFAWTGDINFAASAQYILDHRLYERLKTFLPESDWMDALLAAGRKRLMETAQRRG